MKKVSEIVDRNIVAVLSTYEIKNMDADSLKHVLRMMVQSILEEIAKGIFEKAE